MKIAIYGRVVKPEDAEFLRHFFDLLKENGFEVMIYRGYYLQLKEYIEFKDDYVTFLNHQDLKGKIECLFSLGGDGTLLDTLELVEDSNIPILGINLGRLGFLATTSKEDIEHALVLLKSGNYTVEDRSLLALKSVPDLFGNLSFALNEFTVQKKDASSMIVIHTYIDDHFLSTYWADGLILATPTGSTAYSLSCGGPIIYPGANNLVITPVAPHNLNIRPLIIPDTSVVRFEIETRAEKFYVTLDSRLELIDDSFTLEVRKADFCVKMVRLPNVHFVDTIRNKLNWGFDQRN